MTRVLVVGAGGLGGILSAALGDARDALSLDVVTLSSNAEIARAVEERGFQIRGEDGRRAVRGRVVTELAGDEAPFDFVVLATQPPQVEDAARRVLPYVSDRGALVCLQNGLCEGRVAQIAGARAVIGAVVAWGAAMPEPGVYDKTASGGFTLGVLPGGDASRLPELRTILETVGPVELTENLLGARWSKLAINCAISTLGTLAGTTLGAAMVQRTVRRLALEIMTEAVRVAKREGVRLEKVSGTIDLEWIALTPSEERALGSPSLVAKHGLLLAVGTRYRRMRSSMLSAISRGRTPAVDYLNGEIVAAGERHGVPTPFNRRATELVHALARGDRRPGPATIGELAELLA